MTNIKIGQCKDCMFWGVDYTGVCSKVGLNSEDSLFYIGVYADDDQGLDAKLFTTPDFGCLEFRQKTKKG